jgi:hypothetical protein
VTTSLEGLDLDALDRHLQSVGIARSGELRAELISGGRSNLPCLRRRLEVGAAQATAARADTVGA